MAWDAGLPHKTLLPPPNAGTAEPFRVSPPEAVAYPLELRVQWSSNRATRCAGFGDALGVPWRTCHTDTTSPCTARAARRVRAAACRQVATVDPEGWHHSRPTQRWRTTLWSPMRGETAPSLPRSS